MSDELCLIVEVSDYHEFGAIADSIRNSDKKVKYVEFNFSQFGSWWGLIYTGRRPEKSRLREMIRPLLKGRDHTPDEIDRALPEEYLTDEDVSAGNRW